MSGNTFRFTKEKLLAVPTPVGGQRTIVRDTEAPGLELRVTSTGVRSFSWYRRTKNGQPERVTIGRFPEMTVLQAREEAAKLNALRVTGESPAAERRTNRTELRFGDLFDRYIRDHAKLRKKTWAQDQQRYDQYLAGPLGSLRVSAVNREVVRGLHAQITAAGHPAVANRVLALVSSVFGRAVEWSIVEANPVKGIRRNKEVSRDRFLGSDELPRFFDSLLAEPNEILRDFFLLLLFTGARRDNVLTMAWQDINLEAAMWRIPMTKAGDSHNVPLIPDAVQVLRRRAKANPGSKFVLPGSGESGHLVEPKKGWERLFDRDELTQIVARIEASGKPFEPLPVNKGGKAVAEKLEQQLARAKSQAAALKLDCSGCRLPATRIHDLRRTMGSWQAMTGASLLLIGKSLGHKNVATTQIYARTQTDPVREAMSKAAEGMLKDVDLTGLV